MKSKMRTGVKAGDLMTRNFIWVTPETDLRRCAKTMIKKRVGSLIIKEGTELKGILTEKDILWAVFKKSKKGLKDILAKDLMKRKVVTIKPSDDIVDALHRMKKKKVRRFPVVEQGKIIGMLTLNDILKIDPGLFELIAETVKIKEQTAKLKKGPIRGPRKQGRCEECGEFDLLYRDDGAWICEACYEQK